MVIYFQFYNGILRSTDTFLVYKYIYIYIFSSLELKLECSRSQKIPLINRQSSMLARLSHLKQMGKQSFIRKKERRGEGENSSV